MPVLLLRMDEVGEPEAHLRGAAGRAKVLQTLPLTSHHRANAHRGAERKIACDGQLPLCDRCLRTGRSCGGYGLRLKWQETPDHRRKLACVSNDLPVLFPRQYCRHSGWHFINFTIADVLDHYARQVCSPSRHSLCLPRSLSPSPCLDSNEGSLLAYCERKWYLDPLASFG